ncbi:hypothetical protein Tco_0358969 [Tanacetum coccineum]
MGVLPLGIFLQRVILDGRYDGVAILEVNLGRFINGKGFNGFLESSTEDVPLRIPDKVGFHNFRMGSWIIFLGSKKRICFFSNKKKEQFHCPRKGESWKKLVEKLCILKVLVPDIGRCGFSCQHEREGIRGSFVTWWSWLTAIGLECYFPRLKLFWTIALEDSELEKKPEMVEFGFETIVSSATSEEGTAWVEGLALDDFLEGPFSRAILSRSYHLASSVQ